MGGEFAAWGGVFVAEDDPQSGAIGFVIAGADGTGELGELEARAAQEFGEDAAGVVNEIAKTLGNKNGIYVAGSGLLELMEIVIGQRLFERDFDCGGGLVLVGSDSDGHDGYGFTPRGLFRIGAAGEHGEGAVELLGEHDAGKFMGEGHRAEGKCVGGAFAEVIREAVGVAAEENEFTRATVAAFAEPPSESVRIEVLSASVEKHNSGGAIGVEFLEGGRDITDLRDFNGTPVADAFYIVVEDGAHLCAAGFTEHEEANSHGRFQSSVFLLAVRKNQRCRVEGSQEAFSCPQAAFQLWTLPSFQTVLLALFEEGFAADAERCGRAANLVMRGFERGSDDFALHFLEGAEAGNRAGGTRRSGAHIFRKILGIEEVTPPSRCAAVGTRENHGTLESVAEFADVAGPGVSRQHAARRIAQLRTGAGMDGANRHE